MPNVGFWVTGRDGTDYSGVDGVMIEGFGYDVWSAFGASDWALQLNRVLGLINQGKALIGQAYHTEAAATRLFTLATYLLIKGDHTYVNLDTGLDPEWWPEYGIPIGAPTTVPPANIGALLDASGVYARAYSNGLVLVNPGTTTRIVSLGRAYQLAQPSGGGTVPSSGVLPADWTVAYTTVTSVTLAPGSAAVLVLDAGSATPTSTRAATATATASATATRTPPPTRTPSLPPAVHLDPLSSAIVIGASNTLTGSGFTPGSRVLLFVNSGAVQSYGPFTPTSVTATTLAWTPPATIPLGNGFGSVYVVNTDQGFIQSESRSQYLRGAATANIPTILSINGVGLRPLDVTVPVASVDTVVVPGTVVTIGGSGFNAPRVNLFTGAGLVGPLAPQAGGTASSFQVTIPAGAATGPGTFQVVNSPYSGNVVSNAVSVVLGARLDITQITQSGSTVIVDGAGFSALSVINLWNSQSGGTVYFGGYSAPGQPNVPLTLVSSTRFTFTVPAGAATGYTYLQVVNPPFVASSTTGADPDGAFLLHVP